MCKTLSFIIFYIINMFIFTYCLWLSVEQLSTNQEVGGLTPSLNQTPHFFSVNVSILGGACTADLNTDLCCLKPQKLERKGSYLPFILNKEFPILKYYMVKHDRATLSHCEVVSRLFSKPLKM